MITGRGLFYGASAPDGRSLNIFNEARWDAACQQAAAWGIQVVHPKVADGPRWWYDPTGRAMLKAVGAKHHLQVAPYHYSFGGSDVVAEAQICVQINLEFGAVCPDMEVEYEQSPQGAQWAADFGKVVLQHIPDPTKRGIYPTLFANPLDHNRFPYIQVEQWCTGWIPMVYFAVWREHGLPCTAQEAINDICYPQWKTLDQHLTSLKINPKPILPLIETGEHLPVHEAADFYYRMQDYGYIGSWYDGTYAPYADAIKAVAEPHWPSTPPQQPPAQQQGVDPKLEAIWKINDPGNQIPLVLSHGIPTKWLECIAKGVPIGSPKQPEFKVAGGMGQRFDGGDIFWFEADGTTHVSLH